MAHKLIPRKIKKLITNKSKVFTNISWLFGDHLVTFIGGYFISIWLARHLGPTKLGVYSYALAIFSIASGASQLGLGGIAVKEIVSSKNINNSISTILLLKSIGAIFSILVTTIVLLFTNGGERVVLALVMVSGIIFSPFSVFDNYFDGIVKSKFRVIARKSGFLVKSSFIIVFILLEWKLKILAFIVVSELFVSTIVLVFFYLKQQKKFLLRFDRVLAINLFHQSWPLIISSVGAILYLKIDQIMVVDMIDENTGGYYNVATKYTSIFYFLHTIFITTVFPSLVKEKNNNEPNYIGKFTKLSTILFYLSVGVIIGTYIFIDIFIKYTYGNDYIDAIPIIKIHILSLPLVYFGALLSKWLIIENLTRYSILRHSMGLVVNLLLNYLLIPIYGAIGAAIASIGAMFFAVVVILFFNSRLLILLKIFITSLVYPIRNNGK